ncbi:hypothetical protein GCM10010259_51090 [Streptomyces daghestanicus]|uniref:Uncharacterized protein n=1 Tax=Streptomyces daghestanicus TaxID=66885 RepID=A0ABQ3PTN2_9ACTN|nr:hypothetical protein GCM10010259_51090 [Streptomyces daghestanicus]GHI28378.1 hypothetical protein Sdagh_01080 [Streptomyces daghestanicus]
MWVGAGPEPSPRRSGTPPGTAVRSSPPTPSGPAPGRTGCGPPARAGRRPAPLCEADTDTADGTDGTDRRSDREQVHLTPGTRGAPPAKGSPAASRKRTAGNPRFLCQKH